MKAALPFWTAIVLTALLWAPGASAQRVIYVDTDATGANDGSSWANAFVCLQDALAVTQDGDEVWVAEGVYRPDQCSGAALRGREAAFRIEAAISLVGGFEGDETGRDQADWLAYRTVLSGDILGNDVGEAALDNPTRTDNSITLIEVADAPQSGISIEGLYLGGAHGVDDSGRPVQAGGAIRIGSRAHVVLKRLEIVGNTSRDGAGILINGTYSGDITCRDIVLRSNVAAYSGGGMRITRFDTGHTRCREIWFERNSALQGGGLYNDGLLSLVRSTLLANQADEGGGIYTSQGEMLVVANTRILGNMATSNGGGLYISETSHPRERAISLVNTLVASNTARAGGGIFAEGDPVQIINSAVVGNIASGDGGGVYHWGTWTAITVTNSVLTSNQAGGDGAQFFNKDSDGYDFAEEVSTIEASIIAGPLPESLVDLGGTLHVDPRFVDPAGPDGVPGTLDDDYRLLPDSPSIDAGLASAVPGDTLDLDEDGNLLEQLPIDLGGRARFRTPDGGQDLMVDIGPYAILGPTGVSRLEHGFETPSTVTHTASAPYPNPASDRTEILIMPLMSGTISARLVDLTGRTVLALVPVQVAAGSPLSVTILTLDLPSGIYLLTTGLKSQTRSHSLVVAH